VPPFAFRVNTKKYYHSSSATPESRWSCHQW